MNKYKIYLKNQETERKEYFGIDSNKGDIIECENNDEIISRVEEMRKNTGKDYMWEKYTQIVIKGEKGKPDRVLDNYKDIILEDDLKGIGIRGIFNKLWFLVDGKILRLKDSLRNFRYGLERMFNGYDRTVAWNLNSKITDMLLKNLPKMIKNLSGCPHSYVQKAMKMLNPNISEKDLESNGGNRTEVNVGMSLWQSDLETLLENLRAIEFYESFGYEDFEDDDDEMCMIARKYSIPKYKYSEDIDYKELSRLTEEKYSEVFEFMKEHFTELWD